MNLLNKLKDFKDVSLSVRLWKNKKFTIIFRPEVQMKNGKVTGGGGFFKITF